MQSDELQQIADNADMIIRNYAFTRKNGNISVFNLRHPDHAMVIAEDGKMLESNMDDVEQALVQDIWKKDSVFMEEHDA